MIFLSLSLLILSEQKPWDIPAKILGYPTKKVWFSWAPMDTPKFFDPHPFTRKTPTPSQDIPDAKVWVSALSSCSKFTSK